MKITIVQREIEEAVRAYIHSQIAVKEGMEITMDFTATRGEDGLTAAINIAPSEVVADPEPNKGRQTRTVVSAPKAAPAATSTAPVSDAQAGSTAEAQVDVVDEEPAQGSEALISSGGERVEPVDTDESLVEGDQPLKPSIFSNLRRPTNEANLGDAGAGA